jgi:hypothetical protein
MAAVILEPNEICWGLEVDDTVFHVVLDGRKVGPYDRRTIVGMRIKKALSSAHVLIGDRGAQLTVAELIGNKPASFAPDRSGAFSGSQVRYPASLVAVRGRGFEIPQFKGEIEARLQKDMLRLSGRCRRGFGWKDDRVKIPVADVLYAHANGSQVDVLLRADGSSSGQRLTLELFMPEVAAELAAALPSTASPPQTALADPAGRTFWMALLAVAGVVAAVGVVLLALLFGRGF